MSLPFLTTNFIVVGFFFFNFIHKKSSKISFIHSDFFPTTMIITWYRCRCVLISSHACFHPLSFLHVSQHGFQVGLPLVGKGALFFVRFLLWTRKCPGEGGIRGFWGGSLYEILYAFVLFVWERFRSSFPKKKRKLVFLLFEDIWIFRFFRQLGKIFLSHKRLIS